VRWFEPHHATTHVFAFQEIVYHVLHVTRLQRPVKCILDHEMRPFAQMPPHLLGLRRGATGSRVPLNISVGVAISFGNGSGERPARKSRRQISGRICRLTSPMIDERACSATRLRRSAETPSAHEVATGKIAVLEMPL